MTAEIILEARGLRTLIPSRRGLVRAVDGVDLQVRRGEIVGIVGESGCGKSTLCFSIARLLPPAARSEGRLSFLGHDLLAASPAALRAVRGREMTMILQNPMTALDPVFRIGDQMDEVLRFNASLSREARGRHTLEMLRRVRIPAPEDRVAAYPHQLSGGMRQRVVTAMAASCDPALILADEPTTALDVTVQDQILRLFREIRDRSGTAILIVTHDLGIIRQLCDRVLIMYAGQIVEEGATEAIFGNPRHPYTAALLAAIPRMGQGQRRLTTIEGQPPDLTQPPVICRFAARCMVRVAVCDTGPPPMRTDAATRGAARCFLAGEKAA